MHLLFHVRANGCQTFVHSFTVHLKKIIKTSLKTILIELIHIKNTYKVNQKL